MFQALVSMLRAGDLSLHLHLEADDRIRVAVVPRKGEKDDPALFTPLCLVADAQELDREFAGAIAAYGETRASLADQLKAAQDELKRNVEESKAKTAKGGTKAGAKAAAAPASAAKTPAAPAKSAQETAAPPPSTDGTAAEEPLCEDPDAAKKAAKAGAPGSAADGGKARVRPAATARRNGTAATSNDAGLDARAPREPEAHTPSRPPPAPDASGPAAPAASGPDGASPIHDPTKPDFFMGLQLETLRGLYDELMPESRRTKAVRPSRTILARNLARAFRDARNGAANIDADIARRLNAWATSNAFAVVVAAE